MFSFSRELPPICESKLRAEAIELKGRATPQSCEELIFGFRKAPLLCGSLGWAGFRALVKPL